MRTTRWWSTVAVVAVLGLALTACPERDEVVAPPAEEPPEEPPAEEPLEEPAAVQFDVGVTEEPCPGAVNPDNGCIYLGTLSDLTVGPFAAFGDQLLAGQEAFWGRVNQEGGIGGLFDVHIGDHVEDTEYNPELHVRSYQAVVGDVLALNQTLGTPPTLAIAQQMDADDVLGGVTTWWSGWEFPEFEVVLQSGSNYCIDAMNGVEWAQQEHGVQTVMTVYFPGDYGGDANAGVQVAAGELGLEFVGEVEQISVAAGGETSGAVQAILTNQPDLVFLTLGPTETAQIVGGAAAQGFQGRFVGSHPSFFGALLESPAGPAFEALYNSVGPHENWGGDSDAHRAMQEAFGEGEPGNDGWTFGWIVTYPVRAVLEAAVERGDLTRAGLRAVLPEVVVDYEGALPDKRYGADPNETVVRSTAIGAPDPEGELGLSTIDARYTGSVAEGFDFTEPCQPIG
jgi:ABC-type branched-subunit amino acid transport system substrate-binding protein